MSRYTLSGPALQDIATILAESAARFGAAASERHERSIATALMELAADPARPGSRLAPELADGARIYHLRGSKRRARTGAGMVGAPRHIVLYRVLEPDRIGIARILHDSMDLPVHAADDFGGIDRPQARLWPSGDLAEGAGYAFPKRRSKSPHVVCAAGHGETLFLPEVATPGLAVAMKRAAMDTCSAGVN